MNIKTRWILLSVIIQCFPILSIAQNIKSPKDPKTTFKASRTNTAIIVDGKMNEPAWQQTEARSLNHFYRSNNPEDHQKTEFRMLWDEEKIYLFFECEDKFINSKETERDGKPYLDDCAELMLIPFPDSLNLHFCFELNLYKAANDLIYINDFYQGEDALIFAYNPHYEVEVNVRGTINDNSDVDEGWSMEFAIPHKALANLSEFYPIEPGTKWMILPVRQDRNDDAFVRRSTSTMYPIYDISKSVHQPNRFGLVEFIDEQ